MLLLLIFFTLVGYTMACLGLGVLALRALVGKHNSICQSSAGAMLATSFILGQGFLANLWLLLSLVGWLSPVFVVGIVSVLSISGVILTRRQIFDFLHQARSIWRELWADSWGWRIIAFLALVLCVAWVTSIGRPMASDGAAFYMALPKVIADSHRLTPLPGGYEAFTSIGLQGEMHYAALIAMGSPDAARLFSWPTILAGAVMLLALGRQVGLRRRGQWIAFTMLFTSSAVIWLSGDGKTDLFAAAFGLAAYYWVIQVRYGQRQLALWLAGLFSGFALVAKFTYIPVIIPGIVFLFGWAFQDDFQNRDRQKHALVGTFLGVLQILAGLLIAAGPHLIKNGLLFHNPLAPFGAGTLGWLDQAWYEQDITRRILLTYPLALTFGNYWGQYGHLSPLVLALLPLTLLLPRPQFAKASPLIALSIAALAGVLAWILVRPSVLAPRYILASLSLFILPAARAAEYVSQNESKPRSLATGVMVCIGITIITVGLAFHNITFFPLKTYLYLSGKLPECSRDTQFCEVMTTINQSAALGDRLFINSYQRYWLRPDLIQCLLTSDEIEAYVALQTDEERWNYIYERGFRYLVLFDKPGYVLQNIPAPDMEHIPVWLSVTREQVGLNTILRLESSDSTRETSVVCQQRRSPAWKLVSPYFDPP